MNNLIEERKTGIGGSDTASLFSEGYGCRRRLFYDKVGIPRDFAFKQTGPIKLGKLLEEYFAQEYAVLTGRLVIQVGFERDPDDPSLVVHIDREIRDVERGVGVLEIKAVGNWSYTNVVRYGLIPDYYLQVQHGMLVHGRKWGAFCIGNRDSGKILHWDVERDDLIISRIREEGPQFWNLVEHGREGLNQSVEAAEEYAPVRLPPSDRRCQSCSWRLTCQHRDFLVENPKEESIPDAEELRGLRAEYIDRRELRDEAADLLEEKANEFKAALGDRTAVLIAGKPTYFRSHQKHPVDAVGLAERYDALRKRFIKPRSKLQKEYPPAGTFVKTVTERPLRVY